MYDDLISNTPSPLEVALNRLIEEFARLLARLVEEAGVNIGRIAAELEAIRVLLQSAAMLKPPAEYSTDENLGPGFGTV